MSELLGRADFADASHWERLAPARGVRLPQWATRNTSGKTVRWLRKLGWTVPQFYDWYGGDAKDQRLGCFAKANPTWPLRAFVGLLLEAEQTEVWLARQPAFAADGAKAVPD